MSTEPPSPSGLPGRSRPHLADLARETTESDLWNLDDEPRPAQGAAPAPRAESKLEVRAKNPASPGPKKPAEAKAESPEPAAAEQEIVTPAPAKATEPVPRPAPPKPVRPADDLFLDDPVVPAPAEIPEAPAEPAAEKEPAPAPATAPAPRKKVTEESPAPARSFPRLNRREVMGVAAFAVAAVILGVWVLSRFFTLFSFAQDEMAMPDLPITGEHSKITALEPFWRTPVREGENRDVARREVVMIPVLELTLDEPQGSTGRLRVIFRNDLGEPVGDPITRSFAASRFENSGNATAEFPSTDGFSSDGEFRGYRSGQGPPWTADVFEGPPAAGDAAGGSFKKIATVPLLPIRR